MSGRRGKNPRLRFVERVTQEGSPDFVPPPKRIAAFDDDGTLWAEQSMCFQAFFILDRVLEEAKARGWPRVSMKDDWRRVFPFDQ